MLGFLLPKFYHFTLQQFYSSAAIKRSFVLRVQLLIHWILTEPGIRHFSLLVKANGKFDMT